jgi:hypothetical protein
MVLSTTFTSRFLNDFGSMVRSSRSLTAISECWRAPNAVFVCACAAVTIVASLEPFAT